MIYFDTQPVFALDEDSLILADGTVISGLHAPELLTDDQNGQEIFAARLSLIRKKRNRLLTDCDWTQLPDTALTAAQQEYGVFIHSIHRTDVIVHIQQILLLCEEGHIC